MNNQNRFIADTLALYLNAVSMERQFSQPKLFVLHNPINKSLYNPDDSCN